MNRTETFSNLRPGGAARRLGGTLTALAEVPGVELREFTLAEAVPLGPAQPSRFGGGSWAPRLPRAVRPPLRYLDLGGLVFDWSRAARAVRRWSPDVVLGSPCARLTGAPAGLRTLAVPSLYYCDEPRRADYETAAAASTNPGTRGLYEPLRRAERRLDRAAIAAATTLATNSRHTAAGIERVYGRTATVLTPPVADVFRPDAGDPGEIGGFVLSVGTMIPSKGHDRAIEAVARLDRPLGLTVVCPRAEPAEQARLAALAARAGVALTIRVGIADVELARLYRHALATLYLARLEPLGLASLESQACGTPVVVAAEGGLVETVRDGVGGFAVVGEPEAVAAAVARVIALGSSLRISTREQPVLRGRDDGAQVLAVLQELAGQRSASGWRR